MINLIIFLCILINSTVFYPVTQALAQTDPGCGFQTPLADSGIILISNQESEEPQSVPQEPRVITNNNSNGNWLFGEPAKTLVTRDENNIKINNYSKPIAKVQIPQTTFRVSANLPNDSIKEVFKEKIEPKNFTGGLVRALTDPRVYIVELDGSLNLIESEEIAVRLYGNNWSEQIIWLDDAIRNSYQFGYTITQ